MYGGKFAFQNRLGGLLAGRKFTVFAFVYFVKLRAISKYKPPGGLYLEGRFNGGLERYEVWGLIFAGAYTWRGLFSECYGISQQFRVQCFCLLFFFFIG